MNTERTSHLEARTVVTGPCAPTTCSPMFYRLSYGTGKFCVLCFIRYQIFTNKTTFERLCCLSCCSPQSPECHCLLQISVSDAYIYLTVFNVVSTLSAMYGLGMFLQVTKGNLRHYHFLVSCWCSRPERSTGPGGVRASGHLSSQLKGNCSPSTCVLN